MRIRKIPLMDTKYSYGFIWWTFFISGRFLCRSISAKEAIFNRIQGYRMLEGHISFLMVQSSTSCALKCLQTPKCLSYNVKTVKSELKFHCELSNLTTKSDRSALALQKGFSYYEMVNVASSKESGTEGRWGNWGQCTRCCGGGTQTRIRSCNNGICTGLIEESRRCNTHSCQVSCTVSGSQYHPHETDCTRYYQCANGTPYCKVCPSSLYWDISTKACRWPSDVVCDNGC